MTKNKQFNKAIIDFQRRHGFWPCLDCSTKNETIWHKAEEVTCPKTGKPRSEARQIVKDGGTVSFDKLTWKHGLAGKVNHIQLAEQFYGSRE
jgi:ssDNA-binding Zn-finger/Zn-ribbon topoisomerase 1